jgi:hypothetical protein
VKSGISFSRRLVHQVWKELLQHPSSRKTPMTIWMTLSASGARTDHIWPRSNNPSPVIL